MVRMGVINLVFSEGSKIESGIHVGKCEDHFDRQYVTGEVYIRIELIRPIVIQVEFLDVLRCILWMPWKTRRSYSSVSFSATLTLFVFTFSSLWQE